MQRFIELGDEKLDKELDIIHLLRLLKKLEKLVHDPCSVDNDMNLNLDEEEEEVKEEK